MLEPGSEKTTSGFGVIECLQEAMAKNVSGTMKIRFGSILKFIFLDQGIPVYASSNDPLDKLGQVLLENEKISQDQFNLANEKKEKGKTLGRTLVEMGFLSNRELLQGITQQVKQIVQSLVNLDRISYLFEADNLPKNIVNIEIEPERFLLDVLGGYQDRQSFTQNLLDLDAVLAWKHPDKSGGIRFPLSPQEETATRLVDEKTNVRDICQALPMDDFQAAKILYGLLMLGYLRRKDLISYGANASTSKETSKGNDKSVDLPPTIDLNAPMEGAEAPGQPAEADQTMIMSSPVDETTGLNLDLIAVEGDSSDGQELALTEDLALEENPVPSEGAPPALDIEPSASLPFDEQGAEEPPKTDLPELEDISPAQPVDEIPSSPEEKVDLPASTSLPSDQAEPEPIIDGLDGTLNSSEPILDTGSKPSEADLSFLDDLGQAPESPPPSGDIGQSEFSPVATKETPPKSKPKVKSGGSGIGKIMVVMLLLFVGGLAGVMWFTPDLLPFIPDVFSRRQGEAIVANDPPDQSPENPVEEPTPAPEPNPENTDPAPSEITDPVETTTPEETPDPIVEDPQPTPISVEDPVVDIKPTVFEKWPPPTSMSGAIPFKDKDAYGKAFSASQEGDYRSARKHFKQVLDAEPQSTWMLQLEIACSADTLIRAFSESDGDPHFMVIPMSYQGRDCNRVLWGPFADSEIARAAGNNLPPKLQQSISKPVPVPVGKF